MTRSKLINQFNELINWVRVYQNSSPNFQCFNIPNDLIFFGEQSNEMQALFDDEIARVAELSDRVKQQTSVLSRFSQFSMSVRRYGQFYHLVLFNDLRSILMQTTDAALQAEAKRNEKKLNEFNRKHQPLRRPVPLCRPSETESGQTEKRAKIHKFRF